ncbi:CaiB/BaiF CoA transferase family protein [Ferruginivarius sediminum]|uniref:CoA transferase n=1 Tax=Ferruginivarius sediminum TaxID=2661937 RepID=A0A369TAJ4_9PROT|nr:CaiB/BaiF CoA-transferase family protein [Ferruginivarius sediminum]RDD62349.1 CoA transferase [Ferruginivarius sediminum]
MTTEKQPVSGAPGRPGGPLEGVKVLEVASIGPGPFCAMMLADMGAEVLRLDRAATDESGPRQPYQLNLMNRGRRSVAIDLKRPEAVELALDLAGRADVLVEGFRPGVMERLGLGPDRVRERNPALVYGRITGWGQDGPMSREPGHDINFIALAGVLHAIGRAGGPPTPPLNLVGDFGGATYLAFGIVSALLNAARTGEGQVVDAAMVDGAASMMTMFCGMARSGMWREERGTNGLDSGAPFYDVYETSDGEFIAVGAIEPKFYAELLRVLELSDAALPAQHDREGWPILRDRFAEAFASKTLADWTARFEGRAACVTPVLPLSRAMAHPHLEERGTFTEVAGVRQPAPAPRFSGTPGRIAGPPPRPGQHTRAALHDWGVEARTVTALLDAGVLHEANDHAQTNSGRKA